jgi:2-oxoisovalerate dehydrogenase E1 component alpha subunit
MAKRPARTLEPVPAPATASQPDPNALLRAYRWMLIARQIDDTMWTLRRQGKGHFVVSSAGHEAIGAAAGLAVDLGQDFLAPHYRDLSACLAWGLEPREVMAHYFGRAADPCTGGRQPYAHWGSTQRRILSQEGPQPNVVTHAVGVAFANRRLGSPAVVWIAFGDGGAQKGEVHEAMNFASIHRLSVVFCVQNNLYTQSVPLRLESSVPDLSVRAAGYGMPGSSVDGMDLLAVYPAARAAVERARSGEGPSLIEARAYRYMPNTSNDDDTRYRSREEVEAWRKRDPIARLRAHLLASGALEPVAATTLETEVAEVVAEAALWAESQPDAPPEDALLHTWADRPVPALHWMQQS